MRFSPQIARRAAAALLVLAAACTSQDQSPVAPAAPAPQILAKKTLPVPDLAAPLQREKPVKGETVSKVIGPKGGNLSVPGGLQLIVPPGAVDSDVMFTATTIAGTAVAYDFGPHGITFKQPVIFRQSLGGTNWHHVPKGLRPLIQVGYYTKLVTDAEGDLLTFVEEWQQTTLDIVNGKLEAELWHFSGYMVSSGRR
jgi:hypothetical protein